MAKLFAEGTEVSVGRSRGEIEDLVTRYGADTFGSMLMPGKAVIGFSVNGRKVRFDLPLPSPEDKRFDPPKKNDGTPVRGVKSREQRCDEEHRRMWRALALMVKAKLEACASGIVTFEDEFMAHLVTPNGKTISERYSGQLLSITENDHTPLLIGGMVQ